MLIALVCMIVVSLLPLSSGFAEALKFIAYAVFCVLSVGICTRPISRWHLGLHGSAPLAAGGDSRPGFLRPLLVLLLALVSLWFVSEVFTQSGNEAAESVIKVFESLGFGQSTANDIWIALTVTAFAPLGEELLFRAVIMRSLYDGLRNLRSKRLVFLSNPVVALSVAVLVSSIMFADSHGGDEQSIQFYAIGIMGVIFALSYALSGSLFVPLMAHSINNAIALIMILSEMPSGSVSMAAQISICAGPVVALLALLVLRTTIRH